MKSFYLAIATAMVWGIVPIMEKMGLAKIAPLSGLLIRSFGVIIGGACLILFNNQVLKDAFKADMKTVLLLGLGGLMASVIGQIFFYSALKEGEASKLVPIAGTYPLVSFLLGLVFLGEAFTIPKAIGMVFILAGVFLLR